MKALCYATEELGYSSELHDDAESAWEVRRERHRKRNTTSGTPKTLVQWNLTTQTRRWSSMPTAISAKAALRSCTQAAEGALPPQPATQGCIAGTGNLERTSEIQHRGIRGVLLRSDRSNPRAGLQGECPRARITALPQSSLWIMPET
eukprot:scaffold2862_cov272-Pinguiococcus_pyrenoidosus.AAC.8